MTPIDEVAILACPDAMVFYQREPGPAGELRAQRIQDVLINLCENLKDRFAVLDIPHPLPKQVPPSQLVEWVRNWRRRTDSSYCAYYWPWVKSMNGADQVRVLPPSGYLTGILGQRDHQQGRPAQVEPRILVADLRGQQDTGLGGGRPDLGDGREEPDARVQP